MPLWQAQYGAFRKLQREVLCWGVQVLDEIWTSNQMVVVLWTQGLSPLRLSVALSVQYVGTGVSMQSCVCVCVLLPEFVCTTYTMYMPDG